MAGAAFELAVANEGRLREDLRRMARGLDAAQRRQLLDDLGALLESQTKERFEEKRGPRGDEWEPWQDARYRKAQTGRGKSLLEDEGDLLGSIVPAVDGDQVTVGSVKEYAATHQYGDEERNIPARPYLGLSERDVGELGELVEEFVAEAAA